MDVNDLMALGAAIDAPAKKTRFAEQTEELISIGMSHDQT